VIADWPLSLKRTLHNNAMGITWDGESFFRYGGRELTRHDLSFNETGRWPMHLGTGEGQDLVPQTGAIAWDGETFWKTHYGPVHHPSKGLMLSRFKLPEASGL
jgi:hypothetical protein